MLQKIMQYKKQVFFTIVSALYVVIVSQGAFLTHDDPTNLWIFDTILRENGFFESLFLLFRNFDFNATDYRSFWFPRIIHFVLFIFFRYWDVAYIAIIAILHLFSGWLWFNVTRKITKHAEIAYVLTLLWIFNPYSAPLYVFHHYGYTAFPIIFVLLYALWLLHHSHRSVVPYLLALGVVFSGEAVIPVLFVVAGIFMVHAAIQKNWKRIGGIALHQGVAVALLIGHYWLLQQYKTATEQATRFQLFSAENLPRIPEMFGLWMQDQVLPAFIIPISLFSNDFGIRENGIEPIALLLWIVCILLCFTGGAFLVSGKQPTKQPSWHVLLVILSILIPVSFSMYAYIILVNGGGGYFIRYAFLTGPLIGMTAILLIYTVIRWKVLARILSGGLIAYLLLIFTLTHFQLKPQITQLNREIEMALQEGRERGKKAILVSHGLRYMPATTDSIRWHVPFYDVRGVMFGFINQYVTPIQSPYKYFYSLDRTVTNEFGYEFVSYDFFQEQENTVLLTDITGTRKEFAKDDVLIIGNPAFDFAYADIEKQEIRVCYTWDCYLNSSMYSRARIFSDTDEYALKPWMLDSVQPVLAIDLGNTVAVASYLPDKPYEEGIEGVAYGATADSSGPKGSARSFGVSPYLHTVREGYIKYQISNLEKQNYWIAFDFADFWATEQGLRKFRIRIDTSDMHYDFGPVDIFTLSGGANKPLSILVETNQTDTITIQFSPLDNSELPPVASGIRIYTHPIPLDK